MQQRISRAQLVRGAIFSRRQQDVIRPPWAVAETEFIDRCKSCGDCIDACPTQIIAKGRGGFPEINFHKGECIFCGECAAACKAKALQYSQQPWQLAIELNDRCLAYNRIECRICSEHCQPRAITFRLSHSNVAQPVIDNERCSGCGACIANCPRDAIDIHYRRSLATSQQIVSERAGI